MPTFQIQFQLFALVFLVSISALNTLAQVPRSEARPIEVLVSNYNQFCRSGRYGDALNVANQRLEFCRKQFGLLNTNTIDAQQDTGWALARLERFQEAEIQYKASLTGLTNLVGQNHPDVAAAWSYLARLYDDMHELRKADEAESRVLEIANSAEGKGSLALVPVLSNLAMRHNERGAYARAEPLLDQAFRIQKNTTGSDPTNSLIVERILGGIKVKLGHLAEGQNLLAESLGASKSFFGAAHWQTGLILGDLAEVYEKQGELAKAEIMLDEAARIMETNSERGRMFVAPAYNTLGLLCIRRAEFDKAEFCLAHALGLIAGDSGSNSCAFARQLNNMASFYNAVNDNEHTESLLRQAYTVGTNACGELHRLNISALSNLAEQRRLQGNPVEAIALLERARDLQVRMGWTNSPSDLIPLLSNLGLAYMDLGQLGKAEAALQQAKQIADANQHSGASARPEVFLNLGALYQLQGNYMEATNYQIHGIQLMLSTFGNCHPDCESALNRLAAMYLSCGRPAEALQTTLLAGRIRVCALSNIFRFTSEQQRLHYHSSTEHFDILCTLGAAPDIAAALFREKGIVFDSLLEDRRLLAMAANTATGTKARLLYEAKQRLGDQSRRLSENPNATEAAELAAARQKSLREVESLEMELARQVSGLAIARESLAITPFDVRNAIPTNTLLVDFLRYRHHLLSTSNEMRYGAILLSSVTRPEWVQLKRAKAEEIEANIAHYQELLEAKIPPDSELRAVLEVLNNQIWADIEPHIAAGVNKVLIVPDGRLNFVSFATLMDSEGKFLAEKFFVSYLSSSRDLVRHVAPRTNMQAVIFANPDFRVADPALSSGTVASLHRSAKARRFSELDFEALPGTEREGAALETKWNSWGWPVILFTGSRATEAALRSLSSPFILHLATHGFDLSGGDTKLSEAGTNRNAAGIRLLPNLGETNISNIAGAGLDPMQRSGIALAGAAATQMAWKTNLALPSENDGIVTADEVGALHLDGTWLVTLAACETGKGEALSGEGVLGLRRGFALAGARHLLMTLWPVSDDRTVQFMLDFYERVHDAQLVGPSLASVQRKWLTDVSRTNGLALAVKVAGPFIISSQGPAE